MAVGSKGPEFRTLIKRMPYSLRVGNIPGGDTEYVSIQEAINYCDLMGGVWTIEIFPGTYDIGDITNTGAADITLRGIGQDRCVIAPAAAPATAVIVSTGNFAIEDMTVTAPDATKPALQVVGGICNVDNCEINGVNPGDGIQMIAGDLNLEKVHVIGDIELSTAQCDLLIHGGRITSGNLNTAGAFAHTVRVEYFDFNGNNFSNAATGATVIEVEMCSELNIITDASLVGTVSIRGSNIVSGIKSGTSPWLIYGSESALLSNTNATGSITTYGGYIYAITRAVGPIVWWQESRTLCVVPCTTTSDTIIQWAINAAVAAPAPSATNIYTIHMHPGIYDEQLAAADYVNLRGIGPKGSVVIYQNNANVIDNLGYNELQNLTVRLGTITGSRRFLRKSNAGTLRVTDVIFEVVTPGANGYRLLEVVNSGTITMERCSGILGGTGAALIIDGSAGCTIYWIGNNFTVNNVNAYYIQSSTYVILYSNGNRWAGTCMMFNVPAGGGTYIFDNDAITCTGAWTNGNSTMTFRNCAIEAPVVAGNLARVRLRNCSYRAIQRSGTGNIVDTSPYLSDAPWHVVKWDWMTALACMDVAVRGTPTDAGSGQVLLEVTDNVAGQEAVEANTEAAGSLENGFTPARTPRFLDQIAVDSFDANVTMFFGLRETLGNSLPAATEDHAGFIWDGTNFKSSSDDGTATQTTNLTTPSTDAQHQLEVIVFGGVTTVGAVEFYVDGVLVATHTTRIPVSVLDWQHLVLTAGAGGGDEIDVTVRPGGCQECPN